MNELSVLPELKPIVERRSGEKIFLVLLAGGTVFWFYHCARILFEGLTTLGINTYGATWGILVANTVHIIGISHVGIAISAAVRILRLERYRSIARPAELVTLIALVFALINLFLHVGRPDRFIVNVFLYGRWYSPMVWSMTVFVLYFLCSFSYLYLSIRRDLWVMSTMAPRFRGLYRLLSLGYVDTPAGRNRHANTLYWLAMFLVPIMISVHSVYGFLFGLISAKAGWYNPLQAPYFVLGAIVSGFSAIIVIAALLRRAYRLQSLLTDHLFRVFGIFLAFVVFLYLYFMLSEQLTAQYLALSAETAVSDSLLTGNFSAFFWATVLGLLLPFTYLFVQSVKTGFVHVGLTAVASLVVNLALWMKRFIIVVPSQYREFLPLPRPFVDYKPTFTEWTVTIGSYLVATFVFMLLMKILPVFELPFVFDSVTGKSMKNRSETRRVIMLLSLCAGLALITWGVLSFDHDYAPVKWLLGICFLVAIPLENCLIRDALTAEDDI